MAATFSNHIQHHCSNFPIFETNSANHLSSNQKLYHCKSFQKKKILPVFLSSLVSSNRIHFSSRTKGESIKLTKNNKATSSASNSSSSQLSTVEDADSFPMPAANNGIATVLKSETHEKILEDENPSVSPEKEFNLFPDREDSISTQVVHAGERHGRPSMADTLTTPVALTSTYFFKNTAQLIDFLEGTHKSFEYGRYGNPTTRTVEEKITQIEGAEDTLLSASGMCSATTMLLALVPPGGHIITTTDCYRRTRQFIQTMLPKLGITTTVIDPSDMNALEEALNNHNVSLFFSESPTNPYLRCIDIEYVSGLCRAKNTIVCIDSTFSTPVNQKPIAYGADLVLHSATKYYAGHNDVLAGSISGKKVLVDEIRALHNVLGGVVDPHAAYLILRGIKTLDLRVQRQNVSALKLANILEKHSKVVHVHYPGLPSHPEHEIAKRQMNGYGGVVSFEIDGDLQKTSKFIDALQIPYIAPSLGGCESLVEQPTIISYWDYGPEERAKLGIKDNLVRFSVGIESAEDIIHDVLQALDKI